MSAFQAFAILEPIGRALQDLIKFWLVNIIDTKNKTLDSLLNTFLLSIMAAMVAYLTSWQFKYMVYMWRLKSVAQSTTDEANAMYEQYNSAGKLRFATWNHGMNTQFTAKVLLHLYGVRCGMNEVSALIVNPQTRARSSGRNGESLTYKHFFTVSGRILYHTSKAGVVFLVWSGDRNIGSFAFSSEAAMNEVYDILDKINIPVPEADIPEKKNDRILKIWERSYMESNGTSYNESTLYKDRNFDTFVSRHKEVIMRRIHNFIEANEHGSSFGGLCSYNLGIMLHGLPGTGKTLLMKCVANYLKRDAVMVDMRQVRNREVFQNILKRHPVEHNRGDVVYCFDEFDCVQGVIRKRTGSKTNSAEKEHVSEIDRLKEQYLQLLQSISDSKCSADFKQRVNSELADIKKQMSDIENGLTLDAILTTLDGVIEQRGRVIIACTNHLDQIDDALLRPGRFDLCIKLGKYNSGEIREFLRLIYPKESPMRLAALESVDFPEELHTPAEILNIAHCSSNMDECVQRLCVVSDEKEFNNHTKDIMQNYITCEESMEWIDECSNIAPVKRRHKKKGNNKPSA